MKILRTNTKKTSRGRSYRNFVYATMAAINFQLVSIFLSFSKRMPLTVASLHASTVSRLIMISTMGFCLKSAYDRDRLTGTTFMRLTELITYWFLAVGFAQGIQPDRTFLLKKAKMLFLVPPLLIEIVRVNRLKRKENESG
uniref:Uncharacterized protein n=1 Tax=Cyclophora tenuis TaxID=216820 RepID=A0A7S1D660_CYCTE